jgi:mannose-1-phosphate guanylyltransferase
MAGGSGTRLWPVSRSKRPKQFLRLYGSQTMLQSTFSRLSDLEINSSITICNEDHRFFVAEQLREINIDSSIILEPTGRNTAPAIALAALLAEEDPILLVLSADHLIQDKASFTKAVNSAIPLAEEGKLVTFGVVPSNPNTGYGYIKKGESIQGGYYINSFQEKPTEEVAKKYLKSNDYLWNSGTFLFKASKYLEELNKFQPEIFEACNNSIQNKTSDLDFIRVSEEIFSSCPKDSIDYAVMENTDDGVVIPMDAGWNDIGSWSSIWDVSKKDENYNAILGDVLTHNTSNSYIRSENGLVAAIGVDDLVIVATKEVFLVANKSNSQDISEIISQLKNENRPEWELHREVHRPWGKFDSIDNGNRYQVKRITVKPGAKLSVQKHHHRSEHWIVVQGTAKVTKGDETFVLSVDESTYIPLGTIHALENPGKIDLELIEVQTGSYLGEDDIVRYDDLYGRK